VRGGLAAMLFPAEARATLLLWAAGLVVSAGGTGSAGSGGLSRIIGADASILAHRFQHHQPLPARMMRRVDSATGGQREEDPPSLGAAAADVGKTVEENRKAAVVSGGGHVLVEKIGTGHPRLTRNALPAEPGSASRTSNHHGGLLLGGSGNALPTASHDVGTMPMSSSLLEESIVRQKEQPRQPEGVDILLQHDSLTVGGGGDSLTAAGWSWHVLMALAGRSTAHAGPANPMVAKAGIAIGVLAAAFIGYYMFVGFTRQRPLASRMQEVPDMDDAEAEIWKKSKARQEYRKSVLEAQAKESDDSDDPTGGNSTPASNSASAGATPPPEGKKPEPESYRDRMKRQASGDTSPEKTG